LIANKEAVDPVIAQRIPGTKCILVAKRKDYEKNLGDLGYQFERHVTGVGLMEANDFSMVEHMHKMKVGERTVLFCAEVDAKDDKGSPVKARLLIPVLGFLFHISEIQYFSGFLRFLRNSFFLHRNSSLFLFYFWSSKQ
jgi:hypothetical protein